MIEIMSKFVKWLLALPFMTPFFNWIGAKMNVMGGTVRHYVGAGFSVWCSSVLPWIVIIILLIFIIRKIGLLNFGNSFRFNSEKMEKVQNSSLAGKNIVFLGSSVTKGFAAYGTSFVDMIAARTGAKCVKEAVSGTTLVDDNAKSYVARLKALDPKTPCDLFVCQLSTNDATKKKPLGKVAAAGEAFDTKTVCGAIEYIIDYAKKTWNCPVAFYTNPEYASPEYKDMVDALYAIAKKWDIAVIDLWNDRELNTKEAKKRSCMNDQIHPTKKGYALWTPVIEAALENVVAGKAVPVRPKTEPMTSNEQLKKKKTGKRIGSIVKTVLIIVLAFIILVAVCGIKEANNVLKLFDPSNSNKYLPENIEALPDSPIKGKQILWLGSSVVEGFGARSVSMADYVSARNNCGMIKETYSGTTIATLDENKSYLPRLMKHDSSEKVDLVVVQLSTNDCKGKNEIGNVSDSFDKADFDATSTVGGMESIICYAKETWGCPVLIFSGTHFTESNTNGAQNPAIYSEMVDKMNDVVEKWNGVAYFLDMWNNNEMNEVVDDPSMYALYMADAVHPMRRGYLEFWTPAFEQEIYSIIGENAQA